MKDFKELLDVIKRLRDPKDGCPWDLKQTHESLLNYLIEESYEFIDSVKNNPAEMEEELGDILLQVLLHSQIASEDNQFNIEDVVRTLKDKLIRRHPHVFKDKKVNTEEEAIKSWNEVKSKENKTSINALPALLHIRKLRREDIASNQDLINLVNQELKETKNKEELIANYIFKICQIAHDNKIEPEIAIKNYCKKISKS